MTMLTRSRLLLPVAGIAALMGFAACSADSEDFQEKGEDFITDEDGDIATQTGFVFSDADCEKPANTDTGTTYTCTAVDDEGDTWDFGVEITGDRELTVTSAYHPKVVTQFVVDNLAGAGTVDEECVAGLIADAPEDVLREAATSDALSPEAEEVLNGLFESVGADCLTE